MKVLFVSAGDKNGKPKTVVINQGKSLSLFGIEIRYFCTTGKGIGGYIKSIPELRKELKRYNPDIIHAHYSLSGFLASVSGARPLVVSLMGSDSRMNSLVTGLTKFFSRRFWTVTIVKSAEMKERLNLQDALILPNGVDTSHFLDRDREESYSASGLDCRKKNILFAADPERTEKNYELADKAIKMLNRDDLNLIPIHKVPHVKMSYYYNAADLLLLTSFWEGSPNVIKEAMSCRLPVVSTPVGDAEGLLKDVNGCHICSFDASDVAGKIMSVLEHAERTDGREKIFKMKLDSPSIAMRIIKEYRKILKIET